MARGVLVTFSGYPYTMSSFMPDNGLANLAGALSAQGHEVLILDYGTVEMVRRFFPASVARALQGQAGMVPDLHALERELEAHAERETVSLGRELCAAVRSYRPDFVGFKLWNGDGCTGSTALARALRAEFPSLKIYGGGPQVMFAVKPIIEHTGHFAPLEDGTFDALMQCEAEHLIPALAEHAVGKGPLASLPNVICRDGSSLRINPIERVAELSSLPAPLYDEAVYPALAGDGKLRVLTLDESRGCPFACNFCLQPVISGRRLRLRPATKVVDEMERCIRHYQTNAFRLAGSATPGTLLEGIAEEVLARGLKVRYTAFGRVNYMREGLFPKLKRSGLESLFFGVESGSQRILDEAMGKRATVAQMREILKASRQAGIFTVGSIIAPAPGETLESFQETLWFLAEVRPDGVPVCPPGPVAGTPWYTERGRFGIHIGEGFEEALLDFKFRLLFPPDQWSYPDYSVDGKDTRRMAQEAGALIAAAERMGLLTMFSDDMYLMTRYCHLTPREFRDQTQRWLCTGNWEAVAALVAEMNGAIREAARAAVTALDEGATALPSVA